jgi:hypothetical protein
MARLTNWIVCVCAALAPMATAASLTVRTGETEITVATATGEGGNPVEGKITAGRVVFTPLKTDDSLDVKLYLKDGRQVRLIDTSPPGPARAAPAPMSDDDKSAIADFLAQAKATARQVRFVSFNGDASKAAAVVELVGDKSAAPPGGNDLLWRVELWRFEKTAAGWVRPDHLIRPLEKERFDTVDALKTKRAGTFFIGVPSGLRVEKGKNTQLALPPVPAK